jgi:hypothetical protein
MFRWFSRSQPVDQISIDLTNARAFLPKLRLQFDTADAATRSTYSQSLVEIGTALAYAYALPVADVLAARVTAEKASVMSRDIDAALARCRTYVASPDEPTSAMAARFVAGCTILSHLYRMRLHELTAPVERRAAAAELGASYVTAVRELVQGSAAGR